MKNRTAAREPPGQLSSFILQKGGTAFLESVLVAAYHHGILVLPEIQRAAALVCVLQQIFLHRQIEKGVKALTPVKLEFIYHQFSVIFIILYSGRLGFEPP